jgi:hypothetical protein
MACRARSRRQNSRSASGAGIGRRSRGMDATAANLEPDAEGNTPVFWRVTLSLSGHGWPFIQFRQVRHAGCRGLATTETRARTADPLSKAASRRNRGSLRLGRSGVVSPIPGQPQESDFRPPLPRAGERDVSESANSCNDRQFQPHDRIERTGPRLALGPVTLARCLGCKRSLTSSAQPGPNRVITPNTEERKSGRRLARHRRGDGVNR